MTAEGGQVCDLAHRQSFAAAPSAPGSASRGSAVVVVLLRLPAPTPLSETDHISLADGGVHAVLPLACMSSTGRARVRTGHLGLAGSHPLKTNILHMHEPGGKHTQPRSGSRRRVMPLRWSLVAIAIAVIPVIPASRVSVDSVITRAAVRSAGNGNVADGFDVPVVSPNCEGINHACFRRIIRRYGRRGGRAEAHRSRFEQV